jgi:chromosome segregation ATPase
MIDKRFIDSAQEIRKQYVRVQSELKDSEISVQSLKNFLKDKMDEIEDYRQNEIKHAKTNEDVIRVAKGLHDKIKEIEDKEKILSKDLRQLDEKMNKLKVEESNLLRNIQKKYPKMTLEEIKSEVHRRIEF